MSTVAVIDLEIDVVVVVVVVVVGVLLFDPHSERLNKTIATARGGKVYIQLYLWKIKRCSM